MKILCCCLRACLLTGSELYFYELCDALSELGHTVVLASTETSSFFKEKCKKFHLENLFELNDLNYDLIILSHYLETFSYITDNIGNIPIVNIVHSEIYPNEIPLVHPNVIKYVGVRQSICDKIKTFDISNTKVEMIRNPIDLTKFNKDDVRDDEFGLFVGTMGGVRFKSALHFSQHCKFNNLKSVYISAENTSIPFFDICLPRCNDIEKYFKSCSVSGGVLYGRTYFEARLCGKPTIEYFIDDTGLLTNIDYEEAANDKELKSLREEFDKHEVAKKIIEV
jgi:hypothetical protein